LDALAHFCVFFKRFFLTAAGPGEAMTPLGISKKMQLAKKNLMIISSSIWDIFTG